MRYDLILQTPLGDRKGMMDVCIENGIVNGVMQLLKCEETFRAKIAPNGQCSFNGRLVTLMNTIPYNAVGRITEKEVELSLIGDRESFRLTGKPCE